eukprot:IDg2609t1
MSPGSSTQYTFHSQAIYQPSVHFQNVPCSFMRDEVEAIRYTLLHVTHRSAWAWHGRIKMQLKRSSHSSCPSEHLQDCTSAHQAECSNSKVFNLMERMDATWNPRNV